MNMKNPSDEKLDFIESFKTKTNIRESSNQPQFISILLLENYALRQIRTTSFKYRFFHERLDN